ncbi:MAG TPA: MBL fold metallo-hydrolase [Chitinophagales bacterium]|nr:MBL fold metallo-hydrolase [Chitinophagales bacterium]
MQFPLSEGSFTVDESKKFIPFDPLKDQMKDRPASLLVDIVPFLVKTKNDLIVIDPGLGMQSPEGDFMIHENIRLADFRADDVTMVLLSHLHKDHASGICYGNEPAYNLMFPNATYYCQEQELEYALAKKESPSFVTAKLEFLKHSPQLVLLKGDGKINEDVHYEISGGHTPYHQVFTITSTNAVCFYGGDVLPQPKQLQMKFSAKYDYDGKLAAAKRIEYGRRAAANDYTCLFFHSGNMPMAKVKVDEEGKFLLEKVFG